MRFSVITVSFNQGEFLERAILSVINQTDVDIDYIIVDGGSTDDSRDIIARYASSFSRVIAERDKGAADGLNKGFSHATGDIYCYLNSDDVFEPGALATVARAFAQHPQVDVFCGHAWAIDAEGHRLRRIWSDRYDPSSVAYGMSLAMQASTFIRAEAFRRAGGFNVENRSTWDGEFLLDLYESGARIEVLDAFLSNYRLHSASITGTGSEDEGSRAWNKLRFRRLKGRDWKSSDNFIRWFWFIKRQLRNPQAMIERALKGRVYRRMV